MNYCVDIKDYENIIKNSNITKEEYSSQEFWNIRFSFSILSSLQDFVKYIDENKIKLSSEKELFSFINTYYNHYNSVKNIMSDYLKGNSINQRDKSIVEESILWGITILENLFRENHEEELPYIFNALLSGKIYNSMYYYIKSIEMNFNKKFCLEERTINTQKYLSTILAERKIIEETENIVELNIDKTEEIPMEVQKRIVSMWNRTLDFIKIEISKEKSVLQGNIPFIPKTL